MSHLDLHWTQPAIARLARLASFARLIIYDKPGTGLSDPVGHLPTLEERVADIEAVLDAAGSQQAALFGVSEGGPTSVLMAATHPERIISLSLFGTQHRLRELPISRQRVPLESMASRRQVSGEPQCPLIRASYRSRRDRI